MRSSIGGLYQISHDRTQTRYRLFRSTMARLEVSIQEQLVLREHFGLTFATDGTSHRSRAKLNRLRRRIPEFPLSHNPFRSQEESLGHRRLVALQRRSELAASHRSFISASDSNSHITPRVRETLDWLLSFALFLPVLFHNLRPSKPLSLIGC